MDLTKVIDMFHISPTKMVQSKDVKKYTNILRDYYRLNENEVIQAYEEIMGMVGEEKHPFFYLTSVRRRVLDKQHRAYKKAAVPKMIKDMLK